MAQTSSGKQTQSLYLISAWLVFCLGIFAFVISIPFFLIPAIPLGIFLKEHHKYMGKIRQNKPLSNNSYFVYVVFAVISGIVCAVGFNFLWDLSHGIDTPTEPFEPFLFMSRYGAAAVTGLILVPVTLYYRQRR